MDELCLGVLGGMGPAATFDFCQKLTGLTEADVDQKHIRIVVDSNPYVPDRDKAFHQVGPSPAPLLVSMAARLQDLGADVIAMPCNAATAYLPEIKRALDIPFIDIVSATSQEYLNENFKTPLIIATDATLGARLYNRAFEGTGVVPVSPSKASQQKIMDIVYKIKSGAYGDDVSRQLLAEIRSIKRGTADSVILACTELPITLSGTELRRYTLSSTDALVRCVSDWVTTRRRH